MSDWQQNFDRRLTKVEQALVEQQATLAVIRSTVRFLAWLLPLLIPTIGLVVALSTR